MRRTSLLAVLCLLGHAACVLPEVDVQAPADETTCRTCLEANCTDANTTCQDNPACASLVDCAFQCPTEDLACVTNCFNDNPNGQTDVVELLGCRDQSCVDDCASLPI